MKISPNYKDVVIENQWLKMILDVLRNQISLIEGTLLVNGILLTGFVVVFTKKICRALSSEE